MVLYNNNNTVLLGTTKVKKRREDVNKEEIILATATDGNHGYGVAWISQQLNVKSFIYMPHVSDLKISNFIYCIIKLRSPHYDDLFYV